MEQHVYLHALFSVSKHIVLHVYYVYILLLPPRQLVTFSKHDIADK